MAKNSARKDRRLIIEKGGYRPEPGPRTMPPRRPGFVKSSQPESAVPMPCIPAGQEWLDASIQTPTGPFRTKLRIPALAIPLPIPAELAADEWLDVVIQTPAGPFQTKLRNPALSVPPASQTASDLAKS